MTTDKIFEVGVKLYLNGFPKSGTHAITSLASAMLPRMMEKNWFGNVDNHAFSARLIEKQDSIAALSRFPSNRYVRGHMAHTPELAKAFTENHICKVLIFRDFRDVVVSTAHHSQNGTFPEKEFYAGMNMDELITRIIKGDEYIDGVMERWEMFAPWLDEDWVLKIAYEDFLEHKQGVAELFLRYIYGKTARYNDLYVELDGASLHHHTKRLVNVMDHPECSITYRKGTMGEWKKYFTDEHKELFKERDKNNWLTRLGYEDDRNW